MLRQKSFVKVTGKGTVTKVIKEHYLRDDIPCGYGKCPECMHTGAGRSSVEADATAITSSSSGSLILLAPEKSVNTLVPEAHLILVDTNILLHHLDVLDTEHFHDVVILQTVLDEVKSNSLVLYRRLRSMIGQPDKRFFVFSNEHHRETWVEKEPGETPNDRNDRSIRKAALWYQKHIPSLPTILLTNDQDNRVRARGEGLKAFKLREYCEGLVGQPGYETLMDMLETMSNLASDAGSTSADTTEEYEEHLPLAALQASLDTGRLHRGIMQVSPYNRRQGTVTVDLGSTSLTVHIRGLNHMNRSLQGDTVVIEIFPRAQWITEDVGQLNGVAAGQADDEDDGVNVTATVDVTGGNMIKMSRGGKEEELIMLPASEAIPRDAPERRLSVAKADDPSQASSPEPSEAVPIGKVVGILRRSMRPYCGSILRPSIREQQTQGGIQTVLVQLLDRRLPRIRMRTRNATSLANQRILVAIDGWDRASRYPHGHLMRILGTTGERATETEVILLEHEVAHADFTPAVLACLPSAEWRPTEADYAERADFRSFTICSVDPPGCTDIDDALHARVLENGNYQVGVHIADVTHFVAAGTAIDNEASSRSTTVYLVDKRIDMLPSLLGTNLCSLKSGVERLAFSCIWEISPKAEVVSTHFCKSIIKSSASLTYDQAQARLDSLAEEVVDSITASLRILNDLAKQLRARRMIGGALTLASPEVRFTLDQETQNPVDVILKDMKDANSLVEEFMLLANISVARRIYEVFPETAVLRRHPAPPAENFTSLSKALASRGFSLDVSSSGALAASLDRIVVPEDDFFNRLVRIMATRCMYQAQYFAAGSHGYEAFWHYGLATPIYTHFTSPIRRYADVLVHRLLAAATDSARYAGNAIAFDRQRLEEICNSMMGTTIIPDNSPLTILNLPLSLFDFVDMNHRHRMAQQAQRSSIELYTHLFFKDKAVTETAYIIKVMANAIVALIPQYGIEGLIRWTEEELASAGLLFDAGQGCFKRSGTEEPFLTLFQRITISLRVEEVEVSQRQKLVVQLIDPALVLPSPKRLKE